MTDEGEPADDEGPPAGDGAGSSGDQGPSASGPDEPATEESTEVRRCDYCRLPIPATAVTQERDGVTYEFCSQACRDALDDNDSVFTKYHGFRRVDTGVSAIDESLPQGMPRNSFVMLADLGGSRLGAIQAELAWRALQRGEPVVFVTFLEPPVSVIQEFVTLEWNVLPSLEAGDLRILDCFSYRVDDRDRMYERMNAWNAHLWDVAREATTTVRDPSDLSRVESRLDSVLEDLDVSDEGIVVIDSLTEVGSLVQPVQGYRFVKDLRADVCKGRFVPIFAGATVIREGEEFPHDLRYVADGIVELRPNEEIVEDALLKQLRVRKMGGVLTYPEWAVYEYAAGQGLVTFDPVAQMEGSGSDKAPDDSAAEPPDDTSGDAS